MSESIKSDVVFTKNGFADRRQMIMLYWFDVSGCFVRTDLILSGVAWASRPMQRIWLHLTLKQAKKFAVFDKEKGSWSLLEDHRHDRFYMNKQASLLQAL
ncbi:hypothetical protein PT277_03470 [Acetobacteraceae bacterium ESL0709]|nr:hypothetical protein [Acetobacteraceae bacterium ESL0709]